MHPPVDPCSLANETSKANFHVSNLDVPITFALTKDQIQSQASFQHDTGYFEHIQARPYGFQQTMAMLMSSSMRFLIFL